MFLAGILNILKCHVIVLLSQIKWEVKSWPRQVFKYFSMVPRTDLVNKNRPIFRHDKGLSFHHNLSCKVCQQSSSALWDLRWVNIICSLMLNLIFMAQNWSFKLLRDLYWSALNGVTGILSGTQSSVTNIFFFSEIFLIYLMNKLGHWKI